MEKATSQLLTHIQLTPTLFEDYFRSFAKELYWIAMAYVGNNDVAEDIVQESFMELWTNKKNISSTDNIHAFLIRITKNKSISHIRHQRVKEHHEPFVTEEIIFSSKQNEENDLDEKVQTARKLVESLPENCRRIFLLCVIEGMSYKDAAITLNISVNTIKSQIKIAYQKLRKSGINKSLLILLFFVNQS
ncbi:MAG: RNA polymerase sigma-70 factor [Bacteroidia bacterium]|nr:RNA polymerase sigma-70 factor [Bacteroidia bacterium]